MEYFSALKKEKKYLAVWDNRMKLEDIILSEFSQLQNDKYYMILLI